MKKVTFLNWEEIRNWWGVIVIIISIVVTFMSLKSDVRSLKESFENHVKEASARDVKISTIESMLNKETKNMDKVYFKVFGMDAP